MIFFVDRKTGAEVAGPFTAEQARAWLRERLVTRRTLADVRVARKD
jgi:hypothetical protein